MVRKVARPARSSVGTLLPATVRPKVRSSTLANSDVSAGACKRSPPCSSAILVTPALSSPDLIGRSSIHWRNLRLLDARLRGHDNTAYEGYPHVWQLRKERSWPSTRSTVRRRSFRPTASIG